METLTTLVDIDDGAGFHVLRLAEALKGAGKRDDALREAQRAVALLTKATIDDFDADWENERQTALRGAGARRLRRPWRRRRRSLSGGDGRGWGGGGLSRGLSGRQQVLRL